MLYIINIIFSCLYLSLIKEQKTSLFIIKVLPVILLWVFIVGGQLDIGADYANYLSFFSFPHNDTRFEPLFVWLSRVASDVGIVGQEQFYLYALINAVVIFVATHRLGVRHWAIFYFLLVTVSTFFNNQMNGIRQCTAVVFVYWAFVEFYVSKLKGLSLVAIACGFHYSALVCLIFTFFRRITELLTKFPRTLLIVSCIVALIPTGNSLNESAIELLPDEIREETHYERMYVEQETIETSTDIVYKISKFIFLPLYFLALRLLKLNILSDKERLFFRFGILSYALRCALLINSLIGRFSFYFWIPSILPLYYLTVYTYKQRRYGEMVLILAYASLLYFVKVFMGTAEYRSSFIYFQ